MFRGPGGTACRYVCTYVQNRMDDMYEDIVGTTERFRVWKGWSRARFAPSGITVHAHQDGPACRADGGGRQPARRKMIGEGSKTTPLQPQSVPDDEQVDVTRSRCWTDG